MDNLINVVIKNNKFAIVTHNNPDADAIGSCVFLENLLLNMNKEVDFIIQSKISDDFVNIVGEDRVNKVIIPYNKKYDVLFILDVSDFNRTYYKSGIAKYVIIIDHHNFINNNCDYYINNKDISTGVTLYKIFNNFKITDFMATCLYLTIIGDTDCFKNENISPEIYGIAAELAKMGADINLVNRMYNSINIEYINLLGTVAKNIKIINNICFLIITDYDIEKNNSNIREANKLINFMKNIKNIDISLLLIDNYGTITVRIRSKKSDISNLLSEYDGGGHKHSVGCLIKNKDVYDVLNDLLNKLKTI